MWEERPGEAEELNGIWWQGRPRRASRTFGMLVFILTENYSEGLKEMPKPLTRRVPTLAGPRFEVRNCSHQNLCILRKIKTSGLSERNPGQRQSSKRNRSWQNTAKRKEEQFPLQSKDQQVWSPVDHEGLCPLWGRKGGEKELTSEPLHELQIPGGPHKQPMF